MCRWSSFRIAVVPDKSNYFPDHFLPPRIYHDCRENVKYQRYVKTSWHNRIFLRIKVRNTMTKCALHSSFVSHHSPTPMMTTKHMQYNCMTQLSGFFNARQLIRNCTDPSLFMGPSRLYRPRLNRQVIPRFQWRCTTCIQLWKICLFDHIATTIPNICLDSGFIGWYIIFPLQVIRYAEIVTPYRLLHVSVNIIKNQAI